MENFVVWRHRNKRIEPERGGGHNESHNGAARGHRALRPPSASCARSGFLLNLGVLSKHYAPVDGVYAFRSTFSPLLFAIAYKERQDTCKPPFHAASACASHLMGLDLPPHVAQYHADWRPGENLPPKVFSRNPNGLLTLRFSIGAGARPRQARSAATKHIQLASHKHCGQLAVILRGPITLSSASTPYVPALRVAFPLRRNGHLGIIGRVESCGTCVRGCI